MKKSMVGSHTVGLGPSLVGRDGRSEGGAQAVETRGAIGGFGTASLSSMG